MSNIERKDKASTAELKLSSVDTSLTEEVSVERECVLDELCQKVEAGCTIKQNEGKPETQDLPVAINAAVANNIPYNNAENKYKPNGLWGNIKAPYPTNTWWLNFVLENGDQPIYSCPYITTARPSGFRFWYPKLVDSDTAVNLSVEYDWVIESNEPIAKRGALGYDDMSFSYGWASNNTDVGFDVPFVKGSPFMSVKYRNATPKLTYEGGVITNVRNYPQYNGYVFETSGGRSWAVFTTSPYQLQVINNNLVGGNTPFNGYVRFAFIPDNANIDKNVEILGSACLAVPTGTAVTFTEGKMSFYYACSDEAQNNNLIMLAIPHQRDILTDATRVDGLSKYMVIKGEMTPFRGSKWTLNYPNVNDIGFRYNTPINDSYKNDILDSLRRENLSDINEYNTPSSYFGGKKLAKLARLALIADELGETSLVKTAIATLKVAVEQWLTSSNSNPLKYDTTWGGIVTTQSLADEGADFGNSRYNDHHFHYGYHIYAAAVVIKLADDGSAWLARFNQNLQALLDDYVNIDRQSTNFVRFRNFDFYEGHSWAAGTFVFGLNRNQESTSEAVNAYYAAYLFTLVTSGSIKANIYNMILTAEIRSSQFYWQIKQASQYPPKFSQNHVVGIHWETSIQYITFFGNNAEFIYGIQMLPFTPITFSLLDPAWLREAWPTIRSRTIDSGRDIPQGWLGMMLMAGSIVDKNGCEGRLRNIVSPDDGNSITNTLWWLSSI